MDDIPRRSRAGVYRHRADMLTKLAAGEHDYGRRKYFKGLASSYEQAADLLAPKPAKDFAEQAEPRFFKGRRA
jgi:hypothetical protein